MSTKEYYTTATKSCPKPWRTHSFVHRLYCVRSHITHHPPTGLEQWVGGGGQSRVCVSACVCGGGGRGLCRLIYKIIPLEYVDFLFTLPVNEKCFGTRKRLETTYGRFHDNRDNQTLSDFPIRGPDGTDHASHVTTSGL